MVTNALSDIGRVVLAFLAGTGDVVRFSLACVLATVQSREGMSAAAAQAVLLSKRCVIPVCLVVGPVGAMLAVQSMSMTQAFGVERLLAPLIAATVVRELAPGFSSVMVCFQAGAGIAAELGTMRVQEELDALDVMGLDARALVAGPRILGAALTAPILNALAILVGIFSAYVVAVLLYDLPKGLFTSTVFNGLTLTDVWLSEFKCVLFGFGLGAVSATFGFFAKGGPVGVGAAANRTVVATVIFVLVANYLLNTAFFGLRGGGLF